MDGSCRVSSSECFCSCSGFPSWPCLRCLSSPKSLPRKHKVGSLHCCLHGLTYSNNRLLLSICDAKKQLYVRFFFFFTCHISAREKNNFSLFFDALPKGFSQGVRRSVGGLATILGPLWAGGLTNNLYIMLGMMLALLIMITVSRAQLTNSVQLIENG